jgi:hypothetical protein
MQRSRERDSFRISEMERRYKGLLDISVMVDYIWCLTRDDSQLDHKHKSTLCAFATKQRWK